jgi:hypothetical protein
MPALKLTGFSGETPRIVPRLLAATAAQVAIDARLDDGSLTPYLAPALVTTLVGGPFNTIYRFEEEWLAFAGAVHLARGPVADERLYYTGDGVPKLRVGANVFPLAVPRPSAAPTATPSGVGSGDVVTRAYAYTFVTGFGEETEPSPVSNEINWQPGQTVTLSGIQNAPGVPARNITKQRFYRTQSGTVGTDFYFIAERNVSNANFVDTLPVDEFAEPLPSRHWNAPPDGLTGLIALPNGMMAAFVGRDLYFSEPYRPHAWPEIYVLTTDVPIVALAAMGTTVWVLTEGDPYRVEGSAPDTMVMVKVEAKLPCINARGVVDLGHAVAWPSHQGLAVARSDGAVGLASKNLFAPRDWLLLNPQIMRAGQIEGRWIGSFTAANEAGQDISGSLIIDLYGESFLIRSSIKARAWFYELETSELFFLDDNNAIHQFDAPSSEPLPLSWRSKEFVMSRPDNLGVILIETGGGVSTAAAEAREAEIANVIAARAAAIADTVHDLVGGSIGGHVLAGVTLAGDLLPLVPPPLTVEVSVSVFADRALIASVSTLNSVARLPSGFTATLWEVAVSANAQIEQITLARTADELKQVPAQ